MIPKRVRKVIDEARRVAAAVIDGASLRPSVSRILEPASSERVQDVRAKLYALRSEVLADLGLRYSPRTEAVFDIAVAVCQWAFVDGGAEDAAMKSYLTKNMSAYMANGSWIHLDDSANERKPASA